MEGSWISAVLILPLLWLQWKLHSWFDVKQVGSPARTLNNSEFRNVVLHAGINGFSVALIAILTYVAHWLPATGPWGMILAATLSAVITLLRKLGDTT